MGSIYQINISAGGVPKLPILVTQISAKGLLGDKHRWKGHGGEDKAVCLYSLDVIQSLQAEGHPIYPGSTGENLTLAGLDWDLMQSGLVLRIAPSRFSTGAVLKLTTPAIPCPTIKDSFSTEGNALQQRIPQARISHHSHPGEARWYATVLQEGIVAVGDSVEIVPSTTTGYAGLCS